MNDAQQGITLPGGRYRLIREIGRGGLGIVYEAFDRLKRETVALKRLHVGTGSTWSEQDSIELLMLAHEFRTGASLRHPQIVSLLDYGFDADRMPYFTMGLIPDARGLLPYLYDMDDAEKLRVIAGFLSALAYLHRCGIVHRDLKPGNILISADGQPHLVDFGVALNARGESTRGTELAGTPLYMSPEVLRGDQATFASDLWAVGIILYETFAGSHPYVHDPADKISRIINRILSAQPDLDKLPPALVPIVGRLLLVDPADRFAYAEDVIAPLYAALGVPYTPVETPLDRESYLSAAPFTGRRAELHMLLDALEGTGARALLIGGESGIGKSRLMEEVRIRALVQGWIVVRGYASETGSLPYEMWRDPLRRLLLCLETVDDRLAGVLKAILPDIDLLLDRPVIPAPPLEGKANEHRLDDAIVRVFAGQTQPVLLLLEDVQWAGEQDSLTPLHLLLARLNDLPLVAIASYRSDEAPHMPTILSSMTPILIGRLEADQVEKLVRAIIGTAATPSLIDRLIEITEGNVFFLVETLRQLANQYGALSAVSLDSLTPDFLAGGASRLIQRRLARLPAHYHPAVRLAALIGRQIDPMILGALIQDVDGFLNAAANAAVIEFSDGAWRFAHDKIRTAAIQSIADDDRIAYHCAIAIAIERVYPDDRTRAPALVEHYHAAGDSRSACDRVIVAANVLIDTASYGQALDLLDLGLTLAAQLGDTALQARIAERIGNIHYTLGRYAEAQERYLQCLGLADTLDDSLITLGALGGMARAATRAQDVETTEAYALRALDLARQLNDRRGEALSSSALGIVAFMRGDLDNAEAHQQRCADLAEAVSDHAIHGQALTNLGLIALYRGQFELSHSHLSRALDLQRGAGNLQGMAGAHINLGVLHMQQSAFVVARGHLEEALALFTRIRHQTGVAETISNLAMLALKEGDPDAIRDAYDHALAASEIHAQSGNRIAYIWSRAELGDIALGLAAYPLAEQHYIEALTLSREASTRIGVYESLSGLGQIRARAGDATWAAEVYGLLDTLIDPNPTAWVRMNYLAPLYAAVSEELATEILEEAISLGRVLSIEGVIESVIG